MAPFLQNRFSFLSAACDKEKLPSVGYSSNTYSNSELVPGETATITCSSGYEFKGELIPTATEMPELPPGLREPNRGEVFSDKAKLEMPMGRGGAIQLLEYQMVWREGQI